MKALALLNGDLVISPTGHKTISGAARIQQDMHLALGEHYGNDRFHPAWGSVLVDYVGRPITSEIQLMVESEVNRVINNYIAVQRDEVLRDTLAETRSRFDTSDVVSGIRDISVRVNLDTIRTSVTLVTQAQEQITVVRQVGL